MIATTTKISMRIEIIRINIYFGSKKDKLLVGDISKDNTTEETITETIEVPAEAKTNSFSSTSKDKLQPIIMLEED